MIESRDFLFEFREARDRVLLRRKLLAALQALALTVAVVAWFWIVMR